MDEEEKLVPGDGIYAVEAEILDPKLVRMHDDGSDTRLKGMMSIGFRPTIGDNKRMIEVNLFDFDEEIYGSTLRVYVKAYMRPEVKFDGLDALKEQLAKDEVKARGILS